MAQTLLLLTPRLKALRGLCPSSPPAVPAGATFWVMSSHNSWGNVAGQPHRQQDFSESFWKNLGTSFGFQTYSDLIKIWQKALNLSSLTFHFCLHAFHTVYFLMPIFLPDIMFKLCTDHLPLFLFLVLFCIYSLSQPQTTAQIGKKKLWGVKSM